MAGSEWKSDSLEPSLFEEYSPGMHPELRAARSNKPGPLRRALTMLRVLFLALIAGWLALYLSSRAVLVYWTTRLDPGGKTGTLDCTYFTGTSLFTKDYIYSSQGLVGYVVCPRLVSLQRD